MLVPGYSFQVIWNGEDECYVATCPEFSGISGLGISADAALKEAQVALELAVETYAEEGWTLPEPTQMVDYSGQFRVRIPRKMHGLLAQRALEEGVSLNTYVVSLLSFGLGQTDAFDKVKRWFAGIFQQQWKAMERGRIANSSPRVAQDRLMNATAVRWSNNV